ncbi:ComF family protein [Glaciecola siphonariae]|uniref:ComF family protein n=1 Tax=Glaciecola siphonariae TaxID=521012 RepID=A0ABV9LS54_9ALTE
MGSVTRLTNVWEQVSALLTHHKHCYVCKQSSALLVCEYCRYDTSIAHFEVPGFDLLEKPSVSEHLVSPYYHHLYALGKYEGILKALINRLKFSKEPLAAQVLSRFFVDYIYPRMAHTSELPEVLVPVPLSKWRYAQRGYNQARLLAHALGKRCDLPVYDCVKRLRHTKAQSELNREQRLENIHDAFALCSSIEYKHIALVDDVVTTGATINSACKAIVASYPDITVSVWSMALSPPTRTKTQNSGDI